MTQKHSKWFRALTCGAVAAMASGCAVLPWNSATTVAVAPPALPVEVVSVQPAPPSMQLVRGLAEVELDIADYPVPGLRRQRWRSRARAVEQLATQGYAALAEQRLTALRQEVAGQSQAYYQRHALAYLTQARQFARLGSGQYGQLRAADVAAHRGDYKSAYFQARALVRELWSAQGWITVRRGDTLAGIAARPEVYDNPNLWPLLKAANKGLLYRTSTLQPGWRLRYPLHPRLDEIFAAVEGLLD